MKIVGKRFLRIFGWLIMGIFLLWGTFWTVIVFDSKYHVFNLFHGKSVVLTKGKDIPRFDLTNFATKEKVNSTRESWGKNLFVFVYPQSWESRKEILNIEKIINTQAKQNLRVFVIFLSDSLDSCNLSKVTSKPGYWKLSSKLFWSYRVLPTIWFVENNRLIDLQEGFLSYEELENRIQNFIHPTYSRQKPAVYNSKNWSRIFPPNEAYDIAWSLDEVQQLFSKTTSQGSAPVSKVALIWDQRDSSLFWQVEFVDRVCDCKGLPADLFNLAKVKINPIDEEVMNLEIIEAIPEKDIKGIL